MSVEIAGTTFDNISYDRDADVLYLHVGDPGQAVEFDASTEGHHLRFDADGTLVGVTIVNAKWLLENQGEITTTIPERVHLSESTLADALAS
jgi:uncharacterized protein YuzE